MKPDDVLDETIRFHPSITATVEWVSPMRARAWLGHNTHNRGVKTSSVERYAEAMLRGEWRIVSGGIGWDADDKLTNGQHRLLAIIKSGKGQWLVVVRGLEPVTSQEADDDGIKRTHGDVLALRGHVNSVLLGAAARKLWMLLNFRSLQNQPGRVATKQQIVRLVEIEHPGLRESVSYCTKPALRQAINASTAACLHYLFRMVSAEDADVFFARVADGVELASTSPIYALRRQLAGQKVGEQRANISQTTVAALTIKAFNFWREGREVQHLVWRAGGAHPEVFPRIDGLDLL